MAKINGLSCGKQIKNTGVLACSFDPKIFIGALLIPKGKTFDATDVASFKTTLVGLANENDNKKRVYPIGRFEGLDDQSSDEVTFTTGYGRDYIVEDGDYVWQFNVLNGNKCYHTQLRSFSGQQDRFDVLFVDKQNAILGTTIDNGDGTFSLGGYSLSQIYVPKIQIADGDNPAQYHIRFSLTDAGQFNDNFGFVLSDPVWDVLKTVVGMYDVHLNNVTPNNAASGKFTINPTAGCSNQNLLELFETELSDMSPSPLWEVTDVTSGSALTISTITVIPGLGFEIAVNTSSPYPGANDPIQISLVSPSALEARDVVSPEGNRYESDTVIVKAN